VSEIERKKECLRVRDEKLRKTFFDNVKRSSFLEAILLGKKSRMAFLANVFSLIETLTRARALG
jgi:hypothetical protein